MGPLYPGTLPRQIFLSTPLSTVAAPFRRDRLHFLRPAGRIGQDRRKMGNVWIAHFWPFALAAGISFLLVIAVRHFQKREAARRARRAGWPCPRCGQAFGALAARQSWDFKSIGPPPGAIGIDCSRCGPVLVNARGEFLLDPRNPFARD
jgi:hypothetical protein